MPPSRMSGSVSIRVQKALIAIVLICSQNQGTVLGNTFGPGSGPVLFSDVACDGTEVTIDDCDHPPLGTVGNCTNANDVSISCVGAGGIRSLLGLLSVDLRHPMGQLIEKHLSFHQLLPPFAPPTILVSSNIFYKSTPVTEADARMYVCTVRLYSSGNRRR